jgi:hypothetical protein
MFVWSRLGTHPLTSALCVAGRLDLLASRVDTITYIDSGLPEPAVALRHQRGDTALDPEQPTSLTTSHQMETPREEKDRRV